MVYVDGQGNIVRPRRGIPRIWTLCAVVGVAAVMVQTVPSLAELKDHRARADGLWLSPTVEWHVSLGLLSVAKCDVVHIGAFGRWLSLSDLVPKQLRPRLEAIAADDAQLLLAIIAAVFIAHVLLPGWRFLRHFAASAEALRAGRYWSLVLAAFAHDDLMHVGFNALALSRAAPALQARLKHDRSAFLSSSVPLCPGITPSTPERRGDGVNTQVARRGRVLARVGVRPEHDGLHGDERCERHRVCHARPRRRDGSRRARVCVWHGNARGHRARGDARHRRARQKRKGHRSPRATRAGRSSASPFMASTISAETN